MKVQTGFDFIFSRNIKGFITAFGGANSHMSIRALEQDIPAVIGVGIDKFNKLKNSKKITIDCKNKKIFNKIKKNILLASYFLFNKNNEQFYSFSDNWIRYIKKLNFNINLYSENMDYDKNDALILPGSGDIFKISKINIRKKEKN